VPFFSISGSDFVEMFVAWGVARTRPLSSRQAGDPCIIFMDEIDAVGRHRGAGLGGGHDEREQTLNQLLVEMDGFEMKDNIILSPHDRPTSSTRRCCGRDVFDRQNRRRPPRQKRPPQDPRGAHEGQAAGASIDLDALAAGTPGLSPAPISRTCVNEAALLAARHGKKVVEQEISRKESCA